VLAEQLLLNLVRNGLEAMGDSRAERRIEISTSLAGADMIEVCVRDRGIGLPTGRENNLYAPFVTTKPEGLGMGLAICRSIVESHHGQLWAEPNPGGGTAFHFTLPTLPAPQDSAHASTHQAPRVRRR
jgi:signal transduction histidine kinase